MHTGGIRGNQTPAGWTNKTSLQSPTAASATPGHPPGECDGPLLSPTPTPSWRGTCSQGHLLPWGLGAPADAAGTGLTQHTGTQEGASGGPAQQQCPCAVPRASCGHLGPLEPIQVRGSSTSILLATFPGSCGPGATTVPLMRTQRRHRGDSVGGASQAAFRADAVDGIGWWFPLVLPRRPVGSHQESPGRLRPVLEAFPTASLRQD